LRAQAASTGNELRSSSPICVDDCAIVSMTLVTSAYIGHSSGGVGDSRPMESELRSRA
jgi:hypothetical protein